MNPKKRINSRYPGLTKIKRNSKLAWLSRQNKNGWSLGLALSKRTVWLRHIRFASREEVQKAIDSGIVFIHLKNNPYKPEETKD